MMTTTGSIPMGSTPTYELYLRGSSHGQLQAADCKMLEITGNHINVISRLFQARYSRVLVDTEKGILTYRKRAIEKKVDLQEISQVKKFVKDFFCVNDSDYYWNDSEPEPELESESKFEEQISLKDVHDVHLDKSGKVIKDPSCAEDDMGYSRAEGEILTPKPKLHGSHDVYETNKVEKAAGKAAQQARKVSAVIDDASYPKAASSKK